MDPEKLRFKIFLVLLLAVMVLGTVGFAVTEGLSVGDAFYFSIVTIATVGYGDIHPATQSGKVLALVLIITGVGTFLGVVANATEMMLNRRERRVRVAKLHMVTGLFFSEVGTGLLSVFAEADPHVDRLRHTMRVRSNWSEVDFHRVSGGIGDYGYTIDVERISLGDLRDFLENKGDLLLRLLENPVLLERESFTELLRAVFHLKEELLHREEFGDLPRSDKAHLAGDIQRVYGLLVQQWLEYMQHLKDNYPYLFSLAIRTNPFDQEASPIVK
jgi:hypothetical protein